MSTDNEYNAVQYFLLKAESLCAALLENGIDFDDLVIQNAGSFRKSYRNDIEKVTSQKGRLKPISIVLNRDGIYDKLPEGLFHQTRGSSNTGALNAMVGEYRRYREEEKQSRKFFQPLEQELFRYATMVEQEERMLQFGVLQGNPDRELYRFWNIDLDLPERSGAILVLIMPWVKHIKGDRELTAKALSMVLGKDVSVVQKLSDEVVEGRDNFVLGSNAALSINTVCGNHFVTSYEQWIFFIKGLNVAEPGAYTPGNPYGKLLERFEEIFIPLEITVKFEYQYAPESSVAGCDQILGYGYYL